MIMPFFERYGRHAVQQAIDKLAENGGGTVVIPAGVHETAGIEMRSHIELHLEAGAVLNFTDDPADYPVIRTRWEGYEQESHRPLIYAKDETDVFVTGNGTIEGNGQRWWHDFRAGTLNVARPCFICFENCENVQIRDILIKDSPAWTVHPLKCTNVLISGVTIINPADSPNTDGIDPESCRNVRITGCFIDVGDDCIAIKAGTEDADESVPCENITITGCSMVHGHGGVVLGSEMSGSIRQVVVSSCVFDGTDRGIRIKTRRNRGGTVENLIASGIIMRNVICPVVVNMLYFCGKDGKAPEVSDPAAYPINEKTPHVRNIQLSDIQVTDAKAAAVCLYGLPESPIEDISLSNVHIVLVEGEKCIPVMNARSFPMNRAGLFAEHVHGLRMNAVIMENVEGAQTFCKDVTEAE